MGVALVPAGLPLPADGIMSGEGWQLQDGLLLPFS